VTAERDIGSRTVVHVQCSRVPASLPAGTIERWLRALPEPYALALAGRLANGRGIASLTVLALLARLAASCSPPPLSALQWSERGKPRLPGGPEFSLTHSRGFAACAVAPRGLAVGIDLEPEGRAGAAAIRHVASPAERAALASGWLTATALWTAKEAVIKAAGAGLADLRGVAVRQDRARFAGMDFAWRLLRPGDGLLLALATRGPMPAISLGWSSAAAVFGRRAA
jgi:4'-phosphopantetheinyl transferase superfamily protein